MTPQTLAKIYKKKLANLIREYDTMIDNAKTIRKHNLNIEFDVKVDKLFAEYTDKLLLCKNGETTKEDLEANTEL
jgi:hypothetical protein